MLRWAESWLKARANRSPEASTAYFDALGRSAHLADWQKPRGSEGFWTERSAARRERRRAEPPSQFRQTVDAARILACDILTLRKAQADSSSGGHGGHYRLSIHDGKGGKHRVVPLPRTLEPALRNHLDSARQKHLQDLAVGAGDVHLPDLHVMKRPGAGAPSPLDLAF